MKLAGVMMVRNEADIIEAAVRHNLQSLDRLIVIDHGSFDGTSDILRRLAGEGLALSVLADPAPEFRQGARITQVAREAIARDGADFVFALDADEFLKVSSRAQLEEALARLPAAQHALLYWQTYLPDDFASDAAPFSPTQATRRLAVERHALHKVVVARHFAERPREAIADGNHLAWNLGAPGIMPPHAHILPGIAAIAHVPVRSRRQLEKKVVIGYLAHLASQPDPSHVAYHWRDLYDEVRDGHAFDALRLRTIACNYGLPREQWQPAESVELVADPFAAAVALRYRASADFGALQLLMRFCERLVAGAAAR